MLTEKNVAWGGGIASILGLLVSVVMLVLSTYEVAALVSLLIFETALILLWVYYCNRRNRAIFPFEWEEIFWHQRYEFQDASTIIYEVWAVVRVASVNLPKVPVHSRWTGKGEVRVEVGVPFYEIEPA